VVGSAVAALYLGLWLWVAVAQPDLSDGASVALFVISSVAVGAVTGRWWALALAPAAALGALVVYDLNPCTPGDGIECDLNVPALLLIYFAPPTAALIGVGVAARKSAVVVRRALADTGAPESGC